MLYPGSFILTSTMYPVEVTEEVEIIPPTLSVVMWGIDIDEALSGAPELAGTHVQTLFPGIYSLEESSQIAVPELGGTHVQTLFERAYSLDDYAIAAFPALAGTHVQTLFPLVYLHEPQEAVVSIPPTIGGTLA